MRGGGGRPRRPSRNFDVARSRRGPDIWALPYRLPLLPPYNRESECTAFEIGSARYSAGPAGPGRSEAGLKGPRGHGKGGRAGHRLSYNLCSHLKETLPGGTRSRIARTPRVWSCITRPGRYLESFVTDSIGVASGAAATRRQRLAPGRGAT